MIGIIHPVDGKVYELVQVDGGCKGCVFAGHSKENNFMCYNQGEHEGDWNCLYPPRSVLKLPTL